MTLRDLSPEIQSQLRTLCDENFTRRDASWHGRVTLHDYRTAFSDGVRELLSLTETFTPKPK